MRRDRQAQAVRGYGMPRPRDSPSRRRRRRRDLARIVWRDLQRIPARRHIKTPFGAINCANCNRMRGDCPALGPHGARLAASRRSTSDSRRRESGVTPHDFQGFIAFVKRRRGWSKARLARELGCGPNQISRWIRYDSPRYIDLACAAIAAQIGPWSAAPQDPFTAFERPNPPNFS